MISTQGSLTLLNAHTSEPQVFWKGVKVESVIRVHVHNDEDESRVKLVVASADDAQIADMIAGGIYVKRVAV